MYVHTSVPVEMHYNAFSMPCKQVNFLLAVLTQTNTHYARARQFQTQLVRSSQIEVEPEKMLSTTDKRRKCVYVHVRMV